MLAAALEAEVTEYIEKCQHERDENGHALVVRNGRAVKRSVHTGAGSLMVATPRVNDKREALFSLVDS